MTTPREPGAHPRIIQGGMGIAVSDWRLARAVSRLGQLGVVSGTAIDSIPSGFNTSPQPCRNFTGFGRCSKLCEEMM